MLPLAMYDPDVVAVCWAVIACSAVATFGRVVAFIYWLDSNAKRPL